MVMTEAPISEIDDFVLSHKLPYESGMSSDICYELVRDIGRDTSFEQNLFYNLAEYVDESPILAFDTTVIYTYSKENPLACQGFNKNKDNLDSFKIMTLYAVEKRIPVMFELQKGNVPDVKFLFNTIKKAQAYGLKKPIFVLDRAFMKQENIYNMYKHEINFVGATTLIDSWVAKPLNSPFEEFSTLGQALNKPYSSTYFEGINQLL